MPIPVTCTCGKQLNAKDSLAGKKAKCPGCGNILSIPQLVPAEEETYDFREPEIAAPARPAIAAAKAVANPPVSNAPQYENPARAYPASITNPRMGSPAWSRFLYLLLGLTLIPLGLSAIHSGDKVDIGDRIESTLDAHPEIQEKIKSLPDDATASDIANLFPDHKISGALFPADTWMHWVIALGAAAVYLALILVMFPDAKAQRPHRIAAIGLITATVGIFLLLGFQYIAEWTQGMWVRGTGWLTLLFYIVKFIGFSYRAALDPDNGFLLSCLGFTFGVGLCEELCKALPVLFTFVTPNNLSWRAACLLGLASGLGFGLSEGIHYSSQMYNGIMGAEVYYIRFVSCASLHGMWTGGAALIIFRRQAALQSAHGGNWWLEAIVTILPAIVLHGLYDTLLKKEYDAWSLGVAVVTFVWFIYMVETTRAKYPVAEEA